MNTIMSLLSNYLAIILVGLFLLGLLLLGYILISIKSTENALKKHQEFFEEMQSVLRTTLLTLGFEEKKGASSGDKDGNFKSNVYYLRGKTIVHLRMETRTETVASLYQLAASRKFAYGDDFLVEGKFNEAEKFKSESIAKLKEWVFREGIK